MTYDENSNPVDAQQEDAWLDDLKAFLDEDPSNPPKPVPDFPNPFETEMSDVFREFGTDAPEQAKPAAACAAMEPLPRQQKEKRQAKQKEKQEDNPRRAVIFLTILVLLEAAAIIAVVASWLLWMK